MNLNFNKEGNVFVAEFEAAKDFNFYIEGEAGRYH
jgi:hypothetical protein